jgi:hypothetical protein
MPQVVKAHKVGSTSRRPRTYTSERVCGHRECSTVLSRYNKAEYCHSHAPRVFPRLRGVITES